MDKIRYLLGHDPGSLGYTCVYDTKLKKPVLMISYENNTPKEIYEQLLPFKGESFAIIEETDVFSPGVLAIKSLAKSYGVLIAIFSILEIKIEIVSPRATPSRKDPKFCWKKLMGLSKDKNQSIELALKIESDSDIFKRPRPIKPRNREQELVDIYDDNKVEAYLLTRFLEQILNGEHKKPTASMPVNKGRAKKKR